VHAAIEENAKIGFGDYVSAELAVHEALGAPRYKEGREVPTEERFAAVLAELGVKTPDLPARLTDIHMSALHAAVRVPPHHKNLLAALHVRVKLGLCSNFTHSPTAHRVLDESGLGAHLDALAVSDAVGWRKPRPEIFEAVLGQLGVAPDEVLHVGDNLRADVAGAAAVGLRTVWVTRRVPEPEERLGKHEGPAPDFVVADLAELSELIDRAG
jgi:putative hydrolase of the HAD superfamily